MRDIFKFNLERNIIPSPQECAEAIRKYPQLKSRSVPQMQMWVRNYINKPSKGRF